MPLSGIPLNIDVKSIADVLDNYDKYSARTREYVFRYSSKSVGSNTESLLETVKYR